MGDQELRNRLLISGYRDQFSRDRLSFGTPLSRCCGREIDPRDLDDGAPGGFLVGAIVKVWVVHPLDAELKKRGIDLVAPHHPRRNRKTQDGRRLRRYRRRWHVERLIAWLLRHCRVHTRYEFKAGNFMGFVWLACVRILVRHL